MDSFSDAVSADAFADDDGTSRSVRRPVGGGRAKDSGLWVVTLMAAGLGLAIWLLAPESSARVADWPAWIADWSARIIGLPFLIYLVFLAWKAGAAADGLAASLDLDQRSCQRWSDDERAAGEIVEAVKQYREDGRRTGGAALVGVPDWHRKPGLAAALRAELHHGYLAGDLADAGRLELLLRQRVEPVFVTLDGLQTTAFLVGLLGTLTGVLLTVFIAQVDGGEAVFSAGFLNGVVVKASTTVLGIVTALYIRNRASRLGDSTNALIADLVALYRRVFVPRLGGSNTDIELLAERVAERLRSQLQDFLGTLTQTLEAFLRGLPTEVQTALASALAEKLADPLQRIMSNMTAQVGLVRDAIKDSELAITQGGRDLQVQVERLVGHPQQAGHHLQQTLQQAIRISTEFERIVPQLQGITTALQDLVDQLVAQPSAAAGGGIQARDDLERMIQANRQGLEQIAGAIDSLSALVTGLSAVETGLQEQERRIAAASAALAAQHGVLEANHASLQRLGSRIDELQQPAASHRGFADIDELEQPAAGHRDVADGAAPRSGFWRSLWPRAGRG